MATKEKPVKVCGRRTNEGNPDSWWVDTGIFVRQGDQLIITADNPSAVIIWSGTSGTTPAGETGIHSSRTWSEALANRTGIDPVLEAEPDYQYLWFGSLIGKIGRDGGAFYVGASRTLEAPTSGTLFLAYNDGANFDDNSGYWNVTVTFEELVQLAPTGYGTEMIYADRMNTSLVDDWGVILTVEENVSPSINWDQTAIDNVVTALTYVQDRIYDNTERMFKVVFAGLELRLADYSGAGLVVFGDGNFVRFGSGTRGTVDPRPDDRTYGQISPVAVPDYYPSLIPYGFFNADDKGIQNTIIHELGHILANRSKAVNSSDSSMYDVGDIDQMSLNIMPDPLWSSTTQDSSNDIGVYWEDPADQLGELIPDNFLNWVRNSYIGIEGVIDNYPSAVTDEQKRASAYWVGGIEFTDPDTEISTTSPGIDGFTEEAVTFAGDNNADDLLRSLGLGEADEDCTYSG